MEEDKCWGIDLPFGENSKGVKLREIFTYDS